MSTLYDTLSAYRAMAEASMEDSGFRPEWIEASRRLTHLITLEITGQRVPPAPHVIEWAVAILQHAAEVGR